MISSETVGQIQVDNFVEAIARIYHNKDVKRSIWDVWMHANHHASSIGEELRKGTSGGKLLTEIADFVMWLFSAVNKFRGEIGLPNKPDREQESLIRIGHGFSDLIWNKFPSLCPMCYWRRTGGNRTREKYPGFKNPCDCLLHDFKTLDRERKRHHTVALREFSREHHRNKPKTIDQWQDMFAVIFPGQLRHLTLTSIVFHLLKEMGQVSDAMARMYTYSESNFVAGEPSWRQVWLEDGLADVVSWLFLIVEKLDRVRQMVNDYDLWRFGASFLDKRITLSQIIWKRYGSNDIRDFICPHCQQRACTCPVILVPVDKAVQEVRDRVIDVLRS